MRINPKAIIKSSARIKYVYVFILRKVKAGYHLKGLGKNKSNEKY